MEDVFGRNREEEQNMKMQGTVMENLGTQRLQRGGIQDPNRRENVSVHT